VFLCVWAAGRQIDDGQANNQSVNKIDSREVRLYLLPFQRKPHALI
jgi:hypothetical protein